MKCKSLDCENQSNKEEDFDREGYCWVCSKIKADMKREREELENDK